MQSSIKASLGTDENSWTTFFLRHLGKIFMTAGLIGTGVYQYFKLTKKNASDGTKKPA